MSTLPIEIVEKILQYLPTETRNFFYNNNELVFQIHPQNPPTVYLDSSYRIRTYNEFNETLTFTAASFIEYLTTPPYNRLEGVFSCFIYFSGEIFVKIPQNLDTLRDFGKRGKTNLEIHEIEHTKLQKLLAFGCRVASIDTLIMDERDYDPSIIETYHVKYLKCKIRPTKKKSKVFSLDLPLQLECNMFPRSFLHLPKSLHSLKIVAKGGGDIRISFLKSLKLFSLESRKTINRKVFLPEGLENFRVFCGSGTLKLTGSLPVNLKVFQGNYYKVAGIESCYNMEILEISEDYSPSNPMSTSGGSCLELPKSLQVLKLFSFHGLDLNDASKLTNLKELILNYSFKSSSIIQIESQLYPLIVLPQNLKHFSCRSLSIYCIKFNDSLERLSVDDISSSLCLYSLPKGLRQLQLNTCSAKMLSKLPSGLRLLRISRLDNDLESPVDLPECLNFLEIYHGDLNYLKFNPSLRTLSTNYCVGDERFLGRLPRHLKHLKMSGNVYPQDFCIDLRNYYLNLLEIVYTRPKKIMLPHTLRYLYVSSIEKTMEEQPKEWIDPSNVEFASVCTSYSFGSHFIERIPGLKFTPTSYTEFKIERERETNEQMMNQ